MISSLLVIGKPITPSGPNQLAQPYTMLLRVYSKLYRLGNFYGTFLLIILLRGEGVV
jgi:hypothetical protein